MCSSDASPKAMEPSATSGAGGGAPATPLVVMGRRPSINVRKVLWTCALLGCDYTLEEWGTGDLRLQSEAYRQINPNGLIPALRDGDLVLWESNTICRYLAARHGRTDLLPTEAAARARVEQWMDWQVAELAPAWRYAFMALVKHSPAHASPSARKESVAQWNRLMAILDDGLRRHGPYAAGEHFTLADVVLGLSTHRWLSTPMPRPVLPAVEEYMARLAQQPGFADWVANGQP